MIREEDLRAKREASRKSGKPLRVYLGVDPTALKYIWGTQTPPQAETFQDLGHTAILLIGDFSAMIGGPQAIRDAPAAHARAGGRQREDEPRPRLQNARSRNGSPS